MLRTADLQLVTLSLRHRTGVKLMQRMWPEGRSLGTACRAKKTDSRGGERTPEQLLVAESCVQVMVMGVGTQTGSSISVCWSFSRLHTCWTVKHKTLNINEKPISREADYRTNTCSGHPSEIQPNLKIMLLEWVWFVIASYKNASGFIILKSSILCLKTSSFKRFFFFPPLSS